MLVSRPALMASGALLLVAALVALESPWGFNSRVHSYLMAHPEVVDEVRAAASVKEAEDLARQIKPIIHEHRAAIFADRRDPFVGPKDAKVVVVEFFDYRCPICKAVAMPEVVKLAGRYPDVKFVFKELPIFGDPSKYAASVAIAGFRLAPERYLAIHQAMMSEKALNESTSDKSGVDAMKVAIGEVLRARGVDPGKADALAGSPEIARQIEDVKTLSQTLKVTGTPTFVIGDKMIVGADMAQVGRLIAELKAKSI